MKKQKKKNPDRTLMLACLVVFIAVAAVGLYVNAGKMTGLPGISGGSAERAKMSEDAIAAQRKAIMDSDISDELKAVKLQRLSQQ